MPTGGALAERSAESDAEGRARFDVHVSLIVLSVPLTLHDGSIIGSVLAVGVGVIVRLGRNTAAISKGVRFLARDVPCVLRVSISRRRAGHRRRRRRRLSPSRSSTPRAVGAPVMKCGQDGNSL